MPVSLKHVKEPFFERVLLDQVFVQRDAQAGSVRKMKVAVLGPRGSGHRLDHPGLGKVVEALLNLDVGGAETKMHARGSADRAVGIVRRHHHAARIGHGSDLLHVQNPASVNHVGLQDVGAAGFQNLAKTVVGKVPFARGDRDPDLGGDLLERQGYPQADKALQSSPVDKVRACGRCRKPTFTPREKSS